MCYKSIMEEAEKYVGEEKPKIQNPSDLAKIMRPLCNELMQETFFVILLNTKHNVIKIQQVTVGLLDRTQTHAREIFRDAIIANAHSVILCHNHPSGDPTPSASDLSTTRRLIEAGEIIGIKVLDHLIMGKKSTNMAIDFLSFSNENLMP